MSNHENGSRAGETEQMAQTQCLKVFVQRDYSEGTLVKFQTRFPQELEGRVSVYLHSDLKYLNTFCILEKNVELFSLLVLSILVYIKQ